MPTSPTLKPTIIPTNPTFIPTSNPTTKPTIQPTVLPTEQLTISPTLQPSSTSTTGSTNTAISPSIAPNFKSAGGQSRQDLFKKGTDGYFYQKSETNNTTSSKNPKLDSSKTSIKSAKKSSNGDISYDYQASSKENVKSSGKNKQDYKISEAKYKNKNSEYNKNAFFFQKSQTDGTSKSFDKYEKQKNKDIKVIKKYPIGIELSNNEMYLVQYESSKVKFDYYDNNHPVKTSWVGPNDAILVYDHNDNQKVDKASELCLTDWCPEVKTDFEAMLCKFDANKDKVFNKEDQEFAKFFLWQDKDQDGVSQDGELTTLEDSGILAIDFRSSEEVDGELRELGALNLAEVQWIDGTVTGAYDLVFTHDVF